jgi:uncharacterized membrane protein
VSEHARIGFVASIGNCANRLDILTVVRIGMCTIHRWRRRYICRWCVSISVSDCGRGCNFFATLCEIPMGQNLSVLLSMIVAGAVIVLQLSVKYRRVRIVGIAVADCGRGCNVFATLCEIPTGHSPSVLLSVIVAKCCNCFCVFWLYCLFILLHKSLNCKLTARTTQ